MVGSSDGAILVSAVGTRDGTNLGEIFKDSVGDTIGRAVMLLAGTILGAIVGLTVKDSVARPSIVLGECIGC